MSGGEGYFEGQAPVMNEPITEPTIMVQADQLRADVAAAVVSGLTHYKSRTGQGPEPSAWRAADSAELAAHLALFIAAGIAPALDRHTHRVVTGTLAELQRPADRYMRLRDPVEDQRAFYRPDIAAQARAMERLAVFPGDRVRAAVPVVMPGKAYRVWTSGQEVITIRPAVFLGLITPWAEDDSGLAPFAAAADLALDVARRALDCGHGTIGYAMIAADGHVEMHEVRG